MGSILVETKVQNGDRQKEIKVKERLRKKCIITLLNFPKFLLCTDAAAKVKGCNLYSKQNIPILQK